MVASSGLINKQIKPNLIIFKYNNKKIKISQIIDKNNDFQYEVNFLGENSQYKKHLISKLNHNNYIILIIKKKVPDYPKKTLMISI